MDKIEEFFHYISPILISQTNKNFLKKLDVTYKEENSPNISTQADLDNENLIKQVISNSFPEDGIIAEETATNTSNINSGRKWIIDPICGSSNLNNGIKFFCSNIALVENGIPIASCVIDYSKEEYIWSTGGNKIYINNELYHPIKKSKGTIIDIDLTGASGKPSEIADLYSNFIKKTLTNKNIYLTSFGSSLAFSYTALGNIDAYINTFSYVWDVVAANFLIQQAGGVVTGLDGKKWTLLSIGSIASRDKKLHSELLQFLY